MESTRQLWWRKAIIMYVAGLFGVALTLPIIPKLVAFSSEPLPIPMIALQAVSFVQSGILLFVFVLIGSVLSPKVNLKTPLLDAFLHKQPLPALWQNFAKPGLIAGIVGGGLILAIYAAFKPFLPNAFIENAETLTLPFYTKVFYGGITEELLIRWGVMTFFVWAIYRIFQVKEAEVKIWCYLVAIVISSLLFGIGHLPIANMLGGELTLPLGFYIVLGNAAFGVIAGFLYWRRGLEAAIIAHIMAHVVMTLFATLIN